MKKHFIVLIILTLIILIWFTFKTTQNQDDFTVAIIAPLSGELSYFGEDFLKGAQLAVEEINNKKNSKISIQYYKKSVLTIKR